MNTIHINEQPYTLNSVPPHMTLLRFLRDHLFLSGTKEGCAEGDCGACSVVVLEEESEASNYKAINACLVPVQALSGQKVWTVEGLAKDSKLHPVQQAMVSNLGSQCGYCTPGIVMSLMEAYYRKDLNEPWQIDDQLCGNLCRCTGYRPIRAAAVSIINKDPEDHFTKQLSSKLESVAVESNGEQFAAPTEWKELWAIMEKNPNATFMAGATDLGLDITKKNARYACLVALDRIEGMNRIRILDSTVHIGAATKVSKIESAIADVLPALSRMYRYFGSRQIKNRATIGGNICTASPIGDTAPVLLAYDAVLELRSESGSRRVPIANFFTGYREINMRKNEVLASIIIPVPQNDWFLRSFKVSKRREMDISAVSAGMAVQIIDGVVNDIRLAYGGMAATPKRATETEVALRGKSWSKKNILNASQHLKSDFSPMSDHRGSAWYRNKLAENLLLGFFEEVNNSKDPALSFPHTGTILVEGL